MVDQDVHAKTYSLPNLTYENCIKCGNSDFIINNLNWSSYSGESRMGKWCTKCNVTYYDYAVMTGLRCCFPIADGSDCCSFLSADFECTRPERHCQEAIFQITDFDYRKEKRIKIYVIGKPKKEDIMTTDDPKSMLDAFYNWRAAFFAFESIISLRHEWHLCHLQGQKTIDGG